MATLSPKHHAKSPVEAELRATRDRLAEAQRLARLGSWEWDIVANDVTWSDELFRIYGLRPGETKPSYAGFLERVHPDDRSSVDQRNHKAFADHQPFEDVKRCIRPDGAEFLMRTKGEVIADADGNPLRMLGVCEDVTAELTAERVQAELAAIFRSSDDSIIAMTPAGVIKNWNPSAERLYGYSPDEAIGLHLDRLIPEEIRSQERERRERVVAGERIPTYETQRQRRDGSIFHASVTLSAVNDAHGNLLSLASIARDITERRRFDAQLAHLANHDRLTGLFNRRRFEEELEARVALAKRYGSGATVLMLDLDNFKYVNDVFGHGVGDELLRNVATLLSRSLRETDVLARLGGDEFGVLLPEQDLSTAREVAGKLLQAVRNQVLTIEGRAMKVTTSIGLVTIDGDCENGESVLDEVDRAMYHAKDSGRDQIAMLAQRGSAVKPHSRVSWEHRIREALDNDGFELHCQPILNLSTNEVSQYELLLRMRGPDNLVPPAAFLGVAERLGLIHAIDRWVVAEAIRLLAERPDLHFEVNLSARSVEDEGLMALIGRDIERAESILRA